MTNTLFSQFAQHLYGPSGSYWPEFGTLEAVWRYSFVDQYPEGELASENSVQRYCAGWSPFPSRLRKRYAQEDGLAVLIQNIERVVNASCSLKRVRCIQLEVHEWLLTAGLSPKELESIERFYIPVDARLSEIAAYLAVVLHSVIALS